MFDTEYIRSLCSLEGKNAIITGGNQGIGKGIAYSLAKLGAHVTIVGRNQHTLDESLRMLPGSGHEAQVLDVSDRNAVKEFFQSYHKSHKNLDIYINNAAYSVQATLEETSQEDIDGLLDTNLKGALCCLQQSGQIMKKQRSGSIIVITSVNGLNPHPTQAMYSVTKFALEGAVKALASSLGPYNVRVNSCAPGAIDTPINTEAFNKPGFKETFSNKVALRRIGTIEEIGEAVALLTGDAFRYMTGATVVIDGGLMLKQIP